jgi:hypothetical protein
MCCDTCGCNDPVVVVNGFGLCEDCSEGGRAESLKSIKASWVKKVPCYYCSEPCAGSGEVPVICDECDRIIERLTSLE